MLPDQPIPDYEATRVREDNLLLKLWLHPQATLRYILAHCPTKYVTPLLVLGGIVRALDRLQRQGVRHGSVESALVLAVVMGGLTGWLTYYVYAWGMEVTGRWLGGRAAATTLRTVIAWSLVPTCLTLLTTGLAYSIEGDSYFRQAGGKASGGGSPALLLLLGLVELVLAGWTVVILVKGTMLVQQFSIGRALANVLLPGLLLLAVVFGIMGLYSLLLAAAS